MTGGEAIKSVAGLHESQVAPERLLLDVPTVLRWLGYDAASAGPAEHLRDEVQAMLTIARSIMEPRWAWRAMSATLDTNDDVLRCGERRLRSLAVGRVVLSQLSRSEGVAVFVITIGPRLERESRRLFAAGDSLEGYMLDAIGSAAVEACADLFEQEVLAAVEPQGWRMTNRFSPGYCSWPTTDQHTLFKLLPSRPAGVTLSDHALMQPIKSISGLVGLGPLVKHRPYICDLCGVENCRQRLTATRPA